MRIVIGCPVAERAWVIPSWLRAINDQKNVDADVFIMCVTSPSADDTEDLLLDAGVHVICMEDHHYRRSRRDIDGHVWTDQAYDFMAQVRNGLKMRAFRDLAADYFFSLDSDVILPENALFTLLEYSKEHYGVVAPAVNMVARGTAWNTMSWVDASRPSMAHRPVQEPLAGQADVVMAAMLIPMYAAAVRWEAHRQGEDIGYSINAQRMGIPLSWVPTVKCSHYMYQT